MAIFVAFNCVYVVQRLRLSNSRRELHLIPKLRKQSFLCLSGYFNTFETSFHRIRQTETPQRQVRTQVLGFFALKLIFTHFSVFEIKLKKVFGSDIFNHFCPISINRSDLFLTFDASFDQ